MAVCMREVRAEDAGLVVQWRPDEAGTLFPWMWLRDHGEDEASLDPETLQRRIDTFAIPADIGPGEARLEDGGAALTLLWPDGEPPTRISAALLAAVSGRSEAPERPATRLWGAETLPNQVPSVDYAAVLADEAGLRAWLAKLRTWGFCLVEGVPSTEAATEALALRIGPPQETIFGRMWRLTAEAKDHGDTAYSTEYLEPHTDATYYPDAPALQMFNCFEFDGQGGESILVDGFAVARRLAAEDPEAYATLARVSVPGRYLEPGVDLRAERPVLRLGADGALWQVSFNNYDRAPFLLPPEEMAAFYSAYRAWHERINDRANWLQIGLRPGQALIFDNWRVLHGRMGYSGKRVFYGCYHGRAHYESRLRVLDAAG